ncbi:hypothetical protein [Streptomyces fuscigenes]|uniref:hypothetical protein n=1 Tax=Streptomyces fuscigenes TaxID=1528880 RepID=UPI001F402AE2|nr:hypothetical protein [Streptomyces fuscigenes]MCF3962114.1 hypothetical protein [Streptomyces fuscigenes]
MTRLPRRPSRRARAAVALCAGLVAALSGCADPDEGTNGVGRLPADAIEQKARAAVDGATAVRVTGELVTSGQTYKLDMRLKKSGGAGSVTAHTAAFTLLRVGDALFLKGSPGFWSQAAGGASASPGGSGAPGGDVAGTLGDKYVKVPAGDPSYKQLRGFTDMGALLDGLLALGGKPAKGDRPTVHGTRTIEVKGGDDAKGGTLDVSLEGTPYPVRLTRAGGAGTLLLDDWGKDFALKAPARDQMVDYGSEIPHT